MFEKVKKYLKYLFNFQLQSEKGQAILLLNDIINGVIDGLKINPDRLDYVIYAGVCRSQIRKALSLGDIRKILGKEINLIFVDAKILNVQIWNKDQFDWFKIFEAIATVNDDTAYQNYRQRLELLMEISGIFHLGY